jgi:Flp pilus assembly pilin Flp
MFAVISGVRTLISTWLAARLNLDERGQDLIEYAVWSGVIALALMATGAFVLSGALGKLATGIGNCVDFDDTTSCAPF